MRHELLTTADDRNARVSRDARKLTRSIAVLVGTGIAFRFTIYLLPRLEDFKRTALPSDSVIETQSWCFIAATVALAFVGSAALIVGASLTRGASPIPFDNERPASWGDDRTHWMLGVFERQLVGDAGSTLSNFGTLCGLAAVVASIPVGFPAWWLLGTIIVGLFGLIPIFAIQRGFGQIFLKRERMQNIFDGLSPTIADAKGWATGRDGSPIRSVREYWTNRHPSLAVWRQTSVSRRALMLIIQLCQTSRIYFPFERRSRNERRG